jgi:hypothetical protein
METMWWCLFSPTDRHGTIQPPLQKSHQQHSTGTTRTEKSEFQGGAAGGGEDNHSCSMTHNNNNNYYTG